MINSLLRLHAHASSFVELLKFNLATAEELNWFVYMSYGRSTVCQTLSGMFTPCESPLASRAPDIGVRASPSAARDHPKHIPCPTYAVPISPRTWVYVQARSLKQAVNRQQIPKAKVQMVCPTHQLNGDQHSPRPDTKQVVSSAWDCSHFTSSRDLENDRCI